MEKEDLKNILNAVYELEGLLQLAINGKQDIARLRQLIVDKARLVEQLSSGLPDVASGENMDDRLLAESTLYEAGEEAEDNPGRRPAVQAASHRNAVIARPEKAPVGVGTDKADGGAPGPLITSTPRPVPAVRRSSSRPAIRRLFPLNEVFLFRRELFGGSDEDFNDSLFIVEEMTSFGQAEEYFYSDLQWNPADPNVEQFMNIIRKHFKS